MWWLPKISQDSFIFLRYDGIELPDSNDKSLSDDKIPPSNNESTGSVEVDDTANNIEPLLSEYGTDSVDDPEDITRKIPGVNEIPVENLGVGGILAGNSGVWDIIEDISDPNSGVDSHNQKIMSMTP